MRTGAGNGAAPEAHTPTTTAHGGARIPTTTRRQPQPTPHPTTWLKQLLQTVGASSRPSSSSSSSSPSSPSSSSSSFSSSSSSTSSSSSFSYASSWPRPDWGPARGTSKAQTKLGPSTWDIKGPGQTGVPHVGHQRPRPNWGPPRGTSKDQTTLGSPTRDTKGVSKRLRPHSPLDGDHRMRNIGAR